METHENKPPTKKVLRFLRELLVEAFFDTWKELVQHTARSLLIYTAVTVIAFFLQWKWWGNQLVADSLRIFATIIVAGVIVFVPLLLFNAASIAYKHHEATIAPPESLCLMFQPVSPYQSFDGKKMTYHVGIRSKIPAQNVKMTLQAIRPMPQDEFFRMRAAVNGGAFYLDNNTESCDMNPGDEVYFVIAESWIAGSDGTLRIGVLGKPDRDFPHWSFSIQPSEVWHIHVRVSSANAGSLEKILTLQPYKDNALNIELLD